MEALPESHSGDLALREAHASLTRILGAIEEYVYTGEFLPDGRYRLLFQGPCREHFLGLSAEQARTAVWRDHVHPDDLARFDEVHAEGTRSGRLDVEYRLVGADGVVRWVRDRGRIRVEDGRRFLDGSILDVTDVRRIQDALVAARAEADRLAHVDHLTGVANRRSLTRLLADRGGQALGVLSVDLDRFKQVNDLFGHAAGDAVLVAVADRLRRSVRSDDAVLRMGGEEFLVVVSGVRDDAHLMTIGESIRRRVEAEPVLAGEQSLAVTVSVGAALAPAFAGDLEGFLGDADRALYEAKLSGRNRVHLASARLGAGRRATTEDTEALRIARAMAVAAGAAEGLDIDRLEQVSMLAGQVAHALGRPSPEIMRCRLASLVHDVGTLRVPTSVLTKPGALDPAEQALVRAHAEHGEALVARVPELRVLARIVRHHHERFDGRGYPDGLAGESIPIESRIVAAVGTWSAMRSDRPYRRALDVPTARAELDRAAGTRLDPDVVAALCSVLDEEAGQRAA